MAKADLKLEDSKVEIPMDAQVFAEILSQENADSFAKISGFKECMVTQDKCIYLLADADFARNHAADNRLKLFTVKI
jgi:hypothetical protein